MLATHTVCLFSCCVPLGCSVPFSGCVPLGCSVPFSGCVPLGCSVPFSGCVPLGCSVPFSGCVPLGCCVPFSCCVPLGCSVPFSCAHSGKLRQWFPTETSTRPVNTLGSDVEVLHQCKKNALPHVILYRRPTFKCVVKRLRFRIFKEIANSIIAFWARLDSSPCT